MTDEISRTRNTLYQRLLTIAHREYAPIVADLRGCLEADPDFTARACVNIAFTSKNRDLVDCAVITLLTASPTYAEYREAGRCLLLGSDVYEIEPEQIVGLPPFRILRVDEFIRRKDSDHKSPRLMRDVMGNWLDALETDLRRFDGAVLLNRRAMKNVYCHYHITPSPRAQSILFDNKPPVDSKLAVLKEIAKLGASNQRQDQVRAVELTLQNHIPYTVAVSVLPKMTPIIGIALIEVMTPQQALNSRAWVERSGLLEIPEVKDVFRAKVAQASASAASADHRKSAQGTDADIQAAVAIAKEKAVAQSARIQRSHLHMTDISGSMETTLDVSVAFASRIAALSDGPFMWVVFNDYARILDFTDRTLAGAQRAVKGLRAGGGTSMQAGLEAALRVGFMPEEISIVSDGGERVGNFANALGAIERAGGQSPHITLLRVPGNDPDWFSERVTSAGYRLDKFETDGRDYYVFDQIAAILGGPPALTLIDRILSTSLPHRKGH